MESTAERIWQFEQYSSLFSKMGKGRLFSEIMEKGLAEYDDMEGIAWKWQSIDSSMTKAPTAQESVGPNPTDRGKKWNQASYSRRRVWSPVVDRRNRREST